MQRGTTIQSYTEEEVSTKFGDNENNLSSITFDYTNEPNINRPISGISEYSENTNIMDSFLANEKSLKEMKSGDDKTKSNLFCLAVDGNEHSEFAFKLVTKEFMNKDNNPFNKLLVIYIYDSSIKNLVNYRNQKDTVVDKYTTLLTTSLQRNQYEFFVEDKHNTRYSASHPLDIVNRNGFKFKCDFLFCGYNGMKGPRGDNRELSKGIDFLLLNSRMPTVIIKEGNSRIRDKLKGYKWLFVFDRANSDCFKILETFMPLVTTGVDTIHGLTLLPTFINYDDIKKRFLTVCEDAGVKNETIVYECETYSKNPSALINEKINFGDNVYDFLVFYNNPERLRSDNNYDVASIILKASCNVCFMNGGLCKQQNDI
jgi:hypothetical protein